MENAEEQLKPIESLPEFQALVDAASGKPERSMGESVIPAEPPAWKEVQRIATELLRDPPHVAVLVYLAKSAANLQSFTGLRDSIAAIREKLVNQWDPCEPIADSDDPEDPYYERINLLQELAVDPLFLDGLYKQTLVDIRGIGAFSARDIAVSKGQLTVSDDETARCQSSLISEAFKQTPVDQLQLTLSAIDEVRSECEQLESLFIEKAAPSEPLSLEGLKAKIQNIQSLAAEIAEPLISANDHSIDSAPVADQSIPTDSEVVAAVVDDQSALETNLSNRESVCWVLDRIIDFYLAREPSSPIPILAVRAREMVHFNYFSTLQALAPEHQSDFDSMVGAINNDTLNRLMQDSYRMFQAGELTLSSVSNGAKSGGTDLSVDASIVESEDTSDPAVVDEPNCDSSPQTDSSSQTDSGFIHEVSVGSAKDVLNLLNEVDAYFFNHEPSSPVPLVVGEMRKLVSKNFMELLAAMGGTRSSAEVEDTESE